VKTHDTSARAERELLLDTSNPARLAPPEWPVEAIDAANPNPGISGTRTHQKNGRVRQFLGEAYRQAEGTCRERRKR
jgi:hypothetical protein